MSQSISSGDKGNKGRPSCILTTMREDAQSEYATLLNAATTDRTRVLYSSPFRRLQDKAQVFSLESNASVRSRLTHSLEVAHVGRTLASRLINSGKLRKRFPKADDQLAFVTVVETACLMHDLGNPPFGHFGEAAIREWFRDHKSHIKEYLETDDEKTKKAEYFSRVYGDFTEFDGNPQALRIATRLQFDNDKEGFNLTYSQLAAILKYPWTHDDKFRVENKKIGVFNSERRILEEIRRKLHLNPGQRHLLVYIVEAADDISYCLSDIEDAIEKRAVSWPDFIAFMKNYIVEHHLDRSDGTLASLFTKLPSEFLTIRLADATNNSEKTEQKIPRTWQSAMLNIRVAVTRQVYEHCLQRFDSCYEDFVAGESHAGLVDDSPTSTAWPLDAVREFCNKYLYNCRLVRQREIIAYKVITGLLDSFSDLLTCSTVHFEAALKGLREDKDGTMVTVGASLATLLPPTHLFAYHRACSDQAGHNRRIHEWAQRAHLIVDYISGMTDRFALETYQMLHGIDTNLEK